MWKYKLRQQWMKDRQLPVHTISIGLWRLYLLAHDYVICDEHGKLYDIGSRPTWHGGEIFGIHYGPEDPMNEHDFDVTDSWHWDITRWKDYSKGIKRRIPGLHISHHRWKLGYGYEW
jgi:hypothetical protein